ncbi:MAG: sigma-70 family polymerase sigma factor [Chlorobi bacterium]|nr:sigma-70 family polymerase sigma factor [Chlorobiota bacterium]
MNDQHLRNFTDIQLLECVAAHNTAAISTLYDRFSKLMYGIILAVVRDTDDAEDILQEVFVQIWKNASTYQPALGSPKTWMARLAHNRSVDLLRSKRYRQRKSEVTGLDSGNIDVTPPAEYVDNNTWRQTVQNEQAGYISRALARLPHEQRNLIDMAFLQGYTHQEIATATDIPLGTVKTRIRSGMQELRSYLSGTYIEVSGA